MIDYVEKIQRDGFAIAPNILDSETVSLLIAQLNLLQKDQSTNAVSRRGSDAYGIRDLFNVAPITKAIAHSQILLDLVQPILEKKARVVRGIFFDKNAEANWKVTWHQDLTIAVREKLEVEGYTSWSIKAGIIHVQPPIDILQNMLSLRVHLDDTDELNGALKVLPGSHRANRLSQDDIRFWKQKVESVTCSVPRGGVMAMHPLLLHASSPSINPQHRRVLHFEYCAASLPNRLEWHEV
jgi:ectoine hydroxylase-related dioxygenase (phytanoyl-CoA dioxygenase family)